MADVPFAFIRDMMAAALGVEAHLLRPPYKDAQEFDYRLSRILRADFDYKDIFSASAMHGLEEGTVYYVHNTLELNYVFMPVPGPKPRSVLLFGPFLYEAASGPFFERVLAQNRIGKGDAAALRTFYGTVPEVAEPTMAAAAHAVACQLYGAHDPARVVHRTLASTVTGRAQPDEAFQFSMELLERRYRDENALLAAVSRGDYDAAVRHLGRFSIKNFTPRTGELLRDVKNMLIVVNTLLRKAAESGGVHPVYIDQLSAALAVKIERVADTVEANRLGLEMLRRYCRLVRNDAHSGCSQAVQKTLSYISLHLSGELSLRSIAAALGFNATYLSAQFSRERGETLTAYIHTLRLQTARRLLAHAPVIRHGFIGMQLGASEKRRQWPVSHFVELGKRIWQEEGICPVLLGEASERPLADEYARLTSTPFVDVVGQTNIFELGAVLREMAMLVTNNTGTMHLAAGLGLPLLSIFLATAQPCDTGPYLPGSCCLEPTLPCHPCPHDHDCVLGEKCRHHISASIVADLVLAKLTSGQWREGITTSACREARIWQTATDSRGFITTTCLSDHKADDRTLWLCQQRVYWRRILDDLTSGATEPTPLTNVPLSMACPNYSSQFAARVGKALSHCAHLLQTLLQECAPLPESFDPTGHPLCMTILQHMQSCPELASMAFFWHQLCQHYQGRGPRFLQAVRLLHAHILRWAKSFD